MSRKLPVVSGEKVVKALTRLGYRVVRQKGSHLRLRNLADPHSQPVTVPLRRELKPGLLRRILKDANLTVEEFRRLLR